MAERFACDPEQAQQVAERLISVGASIESSPPGKQQDGRLGSGILDAAVSEFSSRVSTAQQNLARAIQKSATNFDALARGTITLDQQEAERT